MGIVPQFEIKANGDDITAQLSDSISSIEVSDESGEQSDRLTITIADPDARIRLPSPAAELELSFGYDGKLVNMGLFVVDSVSVAGPPELITVNANGTPFARSKRLSSLQEKKARSWDAITIGEIVAKIAAEHGLESVVAEALAARVIAHRDQSDESDIHFLTRMARDYGAIAKPAFGKLLFVVPSQAKSVSGKPLETVSIDYGEVSRYRLSNIERPRFSMVIATWQDKEAAALMEAAAGEGSPVYRLPNPYESSEAAIAAAQASLKHFQMGKTRLNVTLPGVLEVGAETPLKLVNWPRNEFDRQWVATSVKHAFTKDKGIVSNVVCR